MMGKYPFNDKIEQGDTLDGDILTFLLDQELNRGNPNALEQDKELIKILLKKWGNNIQ